MADEPIEVWMIFQVVAATEDAAVSSLDEHIEKLEMESGITSMDVDMAEVQEVDKPHPEIEKGYSRVCEVDMAVKTFSEVISIIINYGPTSIDVKGPEQVTLDIGELRDSMNSVAQMMHQFLQAGAGGMMISRPQDEQDQQSI
jgi:hypothetical protein